MESGHYDFWMDQRAAAMVDWFGRVLFQYGHHPRELAELRFVVRVTDYPESHATRVPMAAVRTCILDRYSRHFSLVLNAYTAFLSVIGARALNPVDIRTRVVICAEATKILKILSAAKFSKCVVIRTAVGR